MTDDDPVAAFFTTRPACIVDALLPAIAAQAEAADQTRLIDPGLIAALTGSEVMKLSATASCSAKNSKPSRPH